MKNTSFEIDTDRLPKFIFAIGSNQATHEAW